MYPFLGMGGRNKLRTRCTLSLGWAGGISLGLDESLSNQEGSNQGEGFLQILEIVYL